MRVLILHSDVAPGAPADEADTLITVDAVRAALRTLGHHVETAPFTLAPGALHSTLARAKPDLVFNLVEAVFGLGQFAVIAAQMLEVAGVPFTGTPGAAMALAGDKPLTKTFLEALGLPTARWSEGPDWRGLDPERLYVVKHATEDASIGLEDSAVVPGRDAPERARRSAVRWGGRWFAEEYLAGREFNISIVEVSGAPHVLAVPEMRFENWPEGLPKLAGYSAKWDETSHAYNNTVRDFGSADGVLAQRLCDLSKAAWTNFGMRGFARVDFRLDADGAPMILEINPNPCLEPQSGMAAAAAHAGWRYEELIARIVAAAYSG